MTEQDMERESYLEWASAQPLNRSIGAYDAWLAGVAHGRAEAWREIEIIAGDALPRDWAAIHNAVRAAGDRG